MVCRGPGRFYLCATASGVTIFYHKNRGLKKIGKYLRRRFHRRKRHRKISAKKKKEGKIRVHIQLSWSRQLGEEDTDVQK